MTQIVLDSSVFIKLFINENDSDQALKLIEKIISRDSVILIPELFSYESFSAYCNSKFQPKLEDVFSLFKKCQPYIIKAPLTQELIHGALNITKFGTPKSGYPSFYDCVYHALAIQEKCTFITADEKHFNKTHKKFGHIKLLKNA